MPWKLNPQPARVYDRNPLEVVVAEVRFHPILRVWQALPDFQDRVRMAFPAFQQQQVQTVEPMGPAGIQVRNESQAAFSDPRSQATLFLTNTALTLESRQHLERRAFARRLAAALQAFLAVHSTFQGTRFGVRYINVIRPDLIGQDLGRTVKLEGLVRQDFRPLLGSIRANGDTRFGGEVISSVGDQGHLALRYAWREPAPGQPSAYHLDFDRYLEADIEPEKVLGLLDSFVQDIYAAYIDAVGSDLLDWMGASREAEP